MLRLNLFWVIIGLLTPHVVSKHVQFYRKDYTYIEEYDAFYKVHWDINGVSWSTAFNACYEEGAKLFYSTGDEWKIIEDLTAAMVEAPNTTEIYVGLHDEFNLGEFITVDGKTTDSPLDAEEAGENFPERCMLLNYETGQYRVSSCSRGTDYPVMPFVCKKVDDESCPTIDHEYKYVKNVKKCYKVNKIQKTWHDAMQTCFMEGGILAIVETRADLPDWVQADVYYFVGFRRMFSSSDFYTVKGDKFKNENFDQSYYDRNSPDSNCGIAGHSNTDLLGARNCNVPSSFICEMSV